MWISNSFLEKRGSSRAFPDGGTNVPCGKCLDCLQAKRAIWTNRIMHENKESESGYFITLTYDADNLPTLPYYGIKIGTLHKPDLTNFFKLLRKNIAKYGINDSRWFKTTNNGINSKIRYFACGEYGKLGDRPHYHALIWNIPDYFIDLDPIHNKMYSDLLEMSWKRGIVDVGTITQASAHYVAKYTLDPLVSQYPDSDPRTRPYATMSRRPGVGNNYLSDEIINYFHNNKNVYTLTEGGIKQPLGRYYKDKIYPRQTDERNQANKRAHDYSVKQQQAEMQNRTYEEYLNYKREQRKNSNLKINSLNKNNKL